MLHPQPTPADYRAYLADMAADAQLKEAAADLAIALQRIRDLALAAHEAPEATAAILLEIGAIAGRALTLTNGPRLQMAEAA